MSMHAMMSLVATFRLHYFLNNCSIMHLIISINFLLIPFCHTLNFNINNFDKTASKMLYDGDAAPSSDGSGFIELNIKDIYRVGWARYAEPLHLWEGSSLAADFTTNFSFVVDTLNKSSFGDGISFFLAPVHYTIPPNSAGPFMGLFNRTTQFAASQNQLVTVEFDTNEFSPEWDPPGPHIGINDRSIKSVVTASWDPLLHSGKECRARITYHATTNNLTVFWTYEESLEAISSLSHTIDLRKSLPEWVKIGFASSTGLYFEQNFIRSWAFSSSEIKSDESQRRIALKIGVAAPAVLFFILVLYAAYRWVVRKQIKRTRGDGNESNDTSNVTLSSINSDLQILALPKQFTYQELVAATNGFAKDRRLGQGGSGQVYKGIIQDLGCAVAVKRIFAQSDKADKQYEKIFINEVKIISRIIHKNLVQFIGWCHEQGECLLVYAYMPNSSLDTHLFGSGATLKWGFRYKIALGLASALHYLHEEAEQCVLHRDIKSANVLLDNNFSTKLGDFGIAKLVDSRLRSQTTGVVGTFGYIAPEYASEGRASKESDIFSFGVVALEIACGRTTYHDGEFHSSLYRWVWHLYLAGNLLDAADERLGVDFDQNEMECLLIVGLWCTHPNCKERPKAGQVIKVLQLEAPLPNLPHSMPDYPMPQPQQQDQSGSSQPQSSLTSSFNTVGR